MKKKILKKGSDQNKNALISVRSYSVVYTNGRTVENRRGTYLQTARFSVLGG